MVYSFKDWDAGKLPPKGWDCADAVADGWTKSDIDNFMRSTVREWTPPAPAPSENPSPRDANEPVQQMRSNDNAQPAEVVQIKTRKVHKADDGWMAQLVENEDGKPKPGASKNWRLFLENHPEMRGVFAYDKFRRKVYIDRQPPWEDDGFQPRPISDTDIAEATMWLESFYMSPKPSSLAPVIDVVANAFAYDDLTEYLEGLKWDGASRVAGFMTEYLGAEDSDYSRIVSKRWLISSIARALQPGCKVDTMPILEGKQGARKSSVLPALYGRQFFTDELSDIGSKDAMMEMQGVWCIEIAEMHRFSQSETNNVKKFVTRQTDRFRPPYGRNIIEAPRRAVMVGTINPEGNAYLRDSTGARRFWPVTVGKIDIEAVERDRDQIWAEALTLYRAGEQWWLTQEEEDFAKIEQEIRTDIDVWTGPIKDAIHGKTKIDQSEVLRAIGVLTKDADWRHSGRVGRVMKHLGWIAKREGTDGISYVSPDAMNFDSADW